MFVWIAAAGEGCLAGHCDGGEDADATVDAGWVGEDAGKSGQLPGVEQFIERGGVKPVDVYPDYPWSVWSFSRFRHYCAVTLKEIARSITESVYIFFCPVQLKRSFACAGKSKVCYNKCDF